MSSIQNFATAQQVSRMINRSEELEKLKTAMSKPGKETRLVFITADGGWGKTRLLYEALWRAGHPKIFPLRGQIDEETSWHIQDKVIVSNVLDLSESRLHLFDEFIDRLRQTFKWHKKATFRSYDPFHTSYRAQRKKHADLSRITKTKEDMYDAFFDDYKQITQTHRLVWAVDTVEQLHFPSVPWLKEKNLLTSDDLEFSIRERLIQLLEEKRLPNTTIILVGRPEGSNKYFKEIRKRIGKNTTIDIIELKLFSLKDTGNYIKQLDEDYHSNPIRPDYDEDSADALKDLAKDRERIEILYRYTEGKPVLLSLFTDILIEGMKIPEALQDTLQDAEERIERDGLEKIQFEIEAAFINQFFYNPNKNDIRSQILIALVRAKRGLDIDRLTFILDSKPGETFQSWQGNPNLREKIKRELSANNPRSLRYLSIVKIGFGGRFILQDELYRIFDKHMLRDDRSKQDEIKARTKLYRQLHSYAKVQIANFRQKQQENRKKDEDSLQWHSPADALTSTFRFLTRAEEDRQIALEEQLLDAQLERLHYKLRLDP